MTEFKPKNEILHRILKQLYQDQNMHSTVDMAEEQRMAVFYLDKYVKHMVELGWIAYDVKGKWVKIKQEGIKFYEAIKASESGDDGKAARIKQDEFEEKTGIKMDTATALAVPKKVVLPVVSPKEGEAVMRGYQDLTKAILDKSDYVKIQGKPYKKKSAWRKYALAFNISDKIIEKLFKTGTHKGIIYAEFTVEAIAPNGRTALGWGACSAKERDFAHPEHDIPATAHTRAKNRAISDLIGAGEVSAEEVC